MENIMGSMRLPDDAKALVSGFVQSPDSFQLFRGIDSGARYIRGDVNSYFVPVPQGPQLLQGFSRFDGRRLQCWKALQIPYAVSVNANMSKGGRLWQALKAIRKTISPPRDGCAAEIKRQLSLVDDHFDHIGVGELCKLVNFVGCRTHAGGGALSQ